MSLRLLCLTAFLSLATTGCTDPASGEWELTDVSWMDIEQVEFFEACSISSRFLATLDVDDLPGKGIEGKITVGYEIEFSSACGESDIRDSVKYDFEGENEGDGEYDIEVDDYYDFECERDGDTLECEDNEGDDWTFER